MALINGTFEFGPENGNLIVRTSRSGVGAKVGHDLTIRATSFRGTVAIDTSSPANSGLMFEVPVNSLLVIEGTGGIKPLSESDKQDIKNTFEQKILKTAQFPNITFRSTSVTGDENSFQVTGDLTLVGVTKPITLHGSTSSDGIVSVRATVVQSNWGIKPYTAMLGALKLKDEVEIEAQVKLA